MSCIHQPCWLGSHSSPAIASLEYSKYRCLSFIISANFLASIFT